MSDDAWKKMKEAKEEEYFQRQNQEALKRIQKRSEEEKPRLSPITGEPMEQLTLMGVVIDRCPTSNGIWLDAGELEQILEFDQSDGKEKKDRGKVLTDFFSNLMNAK